MTQHSDYIDDLLQIFRNYETNRCRSYRFLQKMIKRMKRNDADFIKEVEKFLLIHKRQLNILRNVVKN